ncbi:type II secretion system protein GspM [Tateyamaria sp. syn59]|uniref:type II secretion system protein GspM n=1 Tax=Tateyamaria sp. syn59 TaxID=2576942 RepID=UPI0011BD6F69|nr:type II secretion system protein GspM [Tateyamaria sp. syn59]
MSGRLIDALLGLAPRERWLLGILVAVVLPLGLILGLLLPLNAAKSTALMARTDAIAINVWVQARLQELNAIVPADAARTHDPIGTSGIEKTLIDAGLRDDVAELSQDSTGMVNLRFDAVRFTRLMRWLSMTNADWGYTIEQFRFDAAIEPGAVRAALTLAPQT